MVKISSLFCLVTVLCLGLVKTNFFKTNPHADNLDREISELHSSMIAPTEGITSLQQTDSQTSTFECSQGRDPSEMTTKEYLEAFGKSECSPAIFLPGITASKLHVEINCPVLRRAHPEIFAACGWTSCTPSVFGLAPKKEYSVWIPHVLGPFTIIGLHPLKKECFGSIFAMDWKIEDGKYVLREKEGFRVKAVGYSQETKESSGCGFEAITDMEDISAVLNPPVHKMFSVIRKRLASLGYVEGITTVALPYDWRRTFSISDITLRLKNVVQNMAELSGKKVSIVAHSMGNLNAIHNFAKWTKDFKETYVSRYFSMAAPYLGSPTLLTAFLGGDPSYWLKGMGLPFALYKLAVPVMPSMFDLMPRRQWLQYADTPWMKSIKNRIAVEQSKPKPYEIQPEEDIVGQILPSHLENCSPKDWKDRSRKCLSSMADFTDTIKIGDKMYTLEEISEHLSQHSYLEQSKALYEAEQVSRKVLEDLINPGIDTVVMYSGLLNTPKTLHYKESPKPATSAGQYVSPSGASLALGDGSVLGSSTLMPAFKWSHEFATGTSETKPIIFAEVCSTFNAQDALGKEPFTKNGYVGIACNCGPTTPAGCNHSGMLTDTRFADFLTRSLKTQPKAVPVSQRFADMSESQLSGFRDSCELLSLPS